jgi:hypothetical protein
MGNGGRPGCLRDAGRRRARARAVCAGVECLHFRDTRPLLFLAQHLRKFSDWAHGYACRLGLGGTRNVGQRLSNGVSKLKRGEPVRARLFGIQLLRSFGCDDLVHG